MGCSNFKCDCLNEPEVKDTDIDKKYESFKNTFKKIKEGNISKLNIYLLSVKSIPNFIKFINQPEVLENLNTENNNDIQFKNKYFSKNKIALDQDIIIYKDYQECKKIVEENNNNENEFIIVEKDFIDLIKNNNDKLINKKVIFKLKEKEIVFLPSYLNINLKRTVIYEFVKKEDKKEEDKKDEF